MSARLRPAALLEVLPGQIQQVAAAEQLHPRDPDQIDGEHGGQDAQAEAADQSVAEGLLLIASWQAQHHDGHDQRVVGAEEAFEGDEQGDGNEI